MPLNDTIAAIATPPGRGGVAIVRVSGGEAPRIMRELLRPQREIEYRYMYYGRLEHNGRLLDKGLCVLFESERSFTGEYVFEAHCHGGDMAAALILEAVLELGARPAQPGEFTKRAFINGKISLDQAESVGEMIDARTALAARNAARGLGGELDGRIKQFQNEIADLIANIEAGFDYPDQIDEEMTREKLNICLDGLIPRLDALSSTYSAGRLLARGVKVCILGLPNAGKSSLINALAGRECAIVTDQAGTTRDVLSVELELNGVIFHISDTAGLRFDAELCQAEKIGIERALKTAEKADIVLYVIDALKGKSDEDISFEARVRAGGTRLIEIYNKCDLIDGEIEENGEKIALSVLSGRGMGRLRGVLACEAADVNNAEGLLITNARHNAALKEASDALKNARAAIELPLDCVSIDLRAALRALEEITGESASENMVERIFEKFCLGK